MHVCLYSIIIISSAGLHTSAARLKDGFRAVQSPKSYVCVCCIVYIYKSNKSRYEINDQKFYCY